MTTRDISNSDDVIDSRDVIARIEELESFISDADEAAAESGNDPSSHEAEYGDWREELAKLKALEAEAQGYAPDWQYGATLVRDSYFTEYAEELLKDCGDLPQNIPHYIEIDWEATARNIQVDYTSVEFDGVTYWVR